MLFLIHDTHMLVAGHDQFHILLNSLFVIIHILYLTLSVIKLDVMFLSNLRVGSFTTL
jgi:hypothetical protein